MPYGLAEAVAGILIRPRETLRQVGGGASLGPALVALLLTALVSRWSSTLINPEPAAWLGGSIAYTLLTVASMGLLFFLLAAVYYGLARLLRLRGSFRGLLSGLALANVPSVFTAPLALLAVALGPAGQVLAGLGTMALGIWVTVLSVLAVREVFATSTGRALLIYLLPVALALALALAAAVMVVALTLLLRTT